MKTTMGLALAALCVLGSLGAYLDSPIFIESHAAIDADSEEAKQRNAQAFCSATAGESLVVWDADGEFFCKSRKGRK